MEVKIRERTLDPGVNTCVTGLDLFYGDGPAEHAMDEGWLNLDGSHDALTISEHRIAQRRERGRHV